MKVSDLRSAFLTYFVDNAHSLVPSASLIPKSDPSLLFVNAGMVPFKTYFLGQDRPPFTAVTSAQHCLRVGGKHNDLDNVGKTARHHTFFEMLGNFSFGAYGKSQAIQLAWMFLTRKLALPIDKLWITVFHDDDEARRIWIEEIGIQPERVIACGAADNFWSMGDVGPCGPCTEIFYDHGPTVAGGPPGSVDQDGDRFVEIWNIVFMEFNRSHEGEMSPLPQLCVDTGMGLERIAAVMQGVSSNYDIDTFKALITALQSLTDQPISQVAAQVIADHMRSICWMIHDGVRPSNEGRGYVLRRVIRRALRYAYSDCLVLPCLYKLVSVVTNQYQHHADFLSSEGQITQVLKQEELAFSRTIEQGIGLFEKVIAAQREKQITGEDAFKLYDTYGFPLDIVDDLARERGLTVDISGFEQCMHEQRTRSRQNQQFSSITTLDWLPSQATLFTGYDTHQAEAQLQLIRVDDASPSTLSAGQEAILIFDQTPFYAESGGQVGDQGVIESKNGRFVVNDTQRHSGVVLHHGVLEVGQFSVDEHCSLIVDSKRSNTKKNHSATHLLHDGLIAVLGDHVMQKGSLVTADRLRFDFAHSAPLTDQQINQIECYVNHIINADHDVKTEIMPLDEAKSHGVKALFDEKYDDEVRVLTMGPSRELCGGTHVARTGEIGYFVIVEQTAVAQGVRRVEAMTGLKAVEYMQGIRHCLQEAARSLQSPPDKLIEKIDKMKQQAKFLQKSQEASIIRAMEIDCRDCIQKNVYKYQDIRVLLACIDYDQAKYLRLFTQRCLATDKMDCVVLLQPVGQNVLLSVGCQQIIQEQFSAQTIFRALAEQVGAKGGGKSDFAQGSIANATVGSIDQLREQCNQVLAQLFIK
ncbi:MAG: alanine--tRNA ligase [Legionellales bacterium]|nr:alanine--tRNA ligase [Legionellales bacterium]